VATAAGDRLRASGKAGAGVHALTYQAITTCNGQQWAQYGRTMVTTFCRFWPSDVPLRVYAEGFAGDQNDQVEFVDFHEACPWFNPWAAKQGPQAHGMTPYGHSFKMDCIRFAHKPAVIAAAAKACEADVLIWLDADIVTHNLVTLDWLDSLLPVDADMAWLDRSRRYPECGFMMFRLPGAARLIKTIRQNYKTGVIFKLPEWHDSYVIQNVVQGAVQRGEIKVASLSGKGRDHHHVLPNSPLGDRLDHLKGKRKAIGRTPATERVIGERIGYWA
jgi:hypothetical protein